jgi:hypothetical protein
MRQGRRVQDPQRPRADRARRRSRPGADRPHAALDAGEHNLDIIKEADWIIDLGPEGGAGGGEVVAMGPPTAILKARRSYTAKFLRAFLNGNGTPSFA